MDYSKRPQKAYPIEYQPAPSEAKQERVPVSVNKAGTFRVGNAMQQYGNSIKQVRTKMHQRDLPQLDFSDQIEQGRNALSAKKLGISPSDYEYRISGRQQATPKPVASPVTNRNHLISRETLGGTAAVGQKRGPGIPNRTTPTIPGSERPVTPKTPIGKGAGSDVNYRKQAMDFFTGQGWSKEQSAGIVGNLITESGDFDPDVIGGKRRGDGGKAYGIAQWHPDRQASFQELYNKPMAGSTYEEQLQFIHDELTKGKESSAGDRLRGATTAEQAAEIVDQYYERSSGESRAQRIKHATSVLSDYGASDSQKKEALKTLSQESPNAFPDKAWDLVSPATRRDYRENRPMTDEEQKLTSNTRYKTEDDRDTFTYLEHMDELVPISKGKGLDQFNTVTDAYNATRDSLQKEYKGHSIESFVRRNIPEKIHGTLGYEETYIDNLELALNKHRKEPLTEADLDKLTKGVLNQEVGLDFGNRDYSPLKSVLSPGVKPLEDIRFTSPGEQNTDFRSLPGISRVPDSVQTRILNTPGKSRHMQIVPKYNADVNPLEKYTPEQLSSLDRSKVPGMINDVAPMIEDRRGFRSVDGVPGGGWFDPISGGTYQTKRGATLGLTPDRMDKKTEQANRVAGQKITNQGLIDKQKTADAAKLEQVKYKTENPEYKPVSLVDRNASIENTLKGAMERGATPKELSALKKQIIAQFDAENPKNVNYGRPTKWLNGKLVWVEGNYAYDKNGKKVRRLK